MFLYLVFVVITNDNSIYNHGNSANLYIKSCFKYHQLAAVNLLKLIKSCIDIH